MQGYQDYMGGGGGGGGGSDKATSSASSATSGQQFGNNVGAGGDGLGGNVLVIGAAVFGLVLVALVWAISRGK